MSIRVHCLLVGAVFVTVEAKPAEATEPREQHTHSHDHSPGQQSARGPIPAVGATGIMGAAAAAFSSFGSSGTGTLTY